MSWGGKREGAGRKVDPDKRIKIWPTVEAETLAILSQKAFDDGSSLGEAIDAAAQCLDKKKKRTKVSK